MAIVFSFLDPLVTVSIDGDGEMAKKYKEIYASLPKIKGVSVEGEDSESDQEENDDQGMVVTLSYLDRSLFVYV